MPRIAMISTAHIHSDSFLRNLAEMTSGKAACAVWDDSEPRGRANAEKHNSRFVGDLDALLADDAVDGYVICAENTRHLALLEKVLPVGKPVMCEKPLATTVADARAIAALRERHGTPLISGYFQPFSGANRAARKLLDAGALGKVTHANFRNAHHAAYGHWFDSEAMAWFAEPELSGGGAMMDMGTHAVHLLRHLFGPVEQVWAACGNYSGIYEKVDDYGLMLLRFAGGVLGRVEAGWVFTGGHRGLEIIGSQASLWQTDKLITAAPKQEPTPVADIDERPTRIARLIAVIRGELSEAELADDLAACLDSVAIMAAAYKSADSGKWEAVEKV